MRRGIGTVLLAWLAFIGVDLLVHAGILASMYVDPDPAILGAGEAFRRIPLGYAAFLLLVITVFWLLRRAGIRTWLGGLRFGLVFGFMLGAVSFLAQYSILRVGPGMLAGWALGNTVESAAAGAVAGMGLSQASMKKVAVVAISIFAACLVVTLLLQATGLAPPMESTPAGG